MQQSRELVVILRRRFVAALAVLVAVVVASQGVIYLAEQSEEGLGLIINKAGRQRMLTVHTALEAQRLANADGLVAKTERQQALRETVNELENTRGFIKGKLKELAGYSLSTDLSSFYALDRAGLDYAFGSFLVAARGLAAAPAGEVTLDSPDLARLYDLHDNILALLELEVAAWQRNGEWMMERLRWLQVAALALFLGMVAVISLTVFRPMLGRLRQQMDELETMNATLEMRVAERTAAVEDRAQALAVSEAALRDQSVRLASILNNVADMVITVDDRGAIESVNPATARGFGYAESDLIGQEISILLPAPEKARRDGGLRSYLMGPGGTQATLREIVVRRRDGSVFPVELAAGQMRLGERALFIGTMRDISERKQVEADLRVARDEAESASRSKSAFLANMSHELRTPLNAIMGFSETMAQEALGPIGTAVYRDYAHDIHDSGVHLLTIINDILDVTRIEAGRMTLSESDMDVATVIGGCVRTVRQHADAGKIALTTLVADGLPPLRADERLLKQILLNLLSNAIKFNRPDGRVEIGATLGLGGGLEIFVRDTGIGMAPAQIPLLLTPFAQADDTLARRYDGTGLGLSIAKSLVELHGGRLNIDSALGQGTRVMIWFPGHRVGPSGPGARPSKSDPIPLPKRRWSAA
jgi:PAS domain S-box-containing protein